MFQHLQCYFEHPQYDLSSPTGPHQRPQGNAHVANQKQNSRTRGHHALARGTRCRAHIPRFLSQRHTFISGAHHTSKWQSCLANATFSGLGAQLLGQGHTSGLGGTPHELGVRFWGQWYTSDKGHTLRARGTPLGAWAHLTNQRHTSHILGNGHTP